MISHLTFHKMLEVVAQLNPLFNSISNTPLLKNWESKVSSNRDLRAPLCTLHVLTFKEHKIYLVEIIAAKQLGWAIMSGRAPDRPSSGTLVNYCPLFVIIRYLKKYLPVINIVTQKNLKYLRNTWKIHIYFNNRLRIYCFPKYI